MHQIINNCLKNIEPEIRSVSWHAFIVLLVVIACILTSVYGASKCKSKKKIVVIGLLAFISFIIVILAAILIEKITNNIILLSGVTYYVPYLLCASYTLSKYLKFDFFEISDIVALAYLPARAVNIIGCTVAGCCQGLPAEWGLYSAVLKVNVIPVQLFESVIIFIIWFVLNRLYQQGRFGQKGRCAVYSLIFFGGLNVFTDIFTYIQPKLLYTISVEGIFAFFTMCIGLFMLYIFDKNFIQ